MADETPVVTATAAAPEAAAPMEDVVEEKKEATVAAEEPAKEEEAAPAAAAAEEKPAEAEARAEAKAEPEAEEAAAPAEPVKIGYRTFATGDEAYAYFQDLRSNLRKFQNLNDYEKHNVIELVRLGHPDAARKMGAGVEAVQLRNIEHDGVTSSCFFLIRADGTSEDVSYRKCLVTLFPKLGKTIAAKDAEKEAAGKGKDAKAARGRGRKH